MREGGADGRGDWSGGCEYANAKGMGMLVCFYFYFMFVSDGV